jgi:hypothetical protein
MESQLMRTLLEQNPKEQRVVELAKEYAAQGYPVIEHDVADDAEEVLLRAENARKKARDYEETSPTR